MVPLPKLLNKFQKNIFQNEKTRKNFQLGMYSCLELIAYNNDKAVSERLMNIALHCNQASLMSFASTQDDIYRLFKSNSKQAIKLAEYSWFETKATKNIMSVKWPKDKAFIAFEHHSCLLTQEDCEQRIKKIH